MKAAVVGGGITGCATALHLASQGFDVELYEQSSSLGGILQDLRINGECYFNGCQYLNVSAPWFSDLRERIDCAFNEFEHTYGSCTELFGEQVLHQDFAQPVARISCAGLSAITGTDLKARLEAYPHEIAAKVIEWTRGFASNAERLHSSCAAAMQIPRVYFQNSDQTIMNLKRSSTTADELLGLPRSVINPGARLARACLPTHGFNDFFLHFEKLLKKSNVKISLRNPITPRKVRGDSREVRFFSRRAEISPDLLIWCANPVALIKAAGCGKLDNPVSHVRVFCCDITKSPAHIKPHYLQVFSPFVDVIRIYVYMLGEKPKASIECFDRGEDPRKAIAYAEDLFEAFGMKVSLKPVLGISQKRHVLYTVDDYERFRNFRLRAKALGVVDGAWEMYGRDSKIDRILSDIKPDYRGAIIPSNSEESAMPHSS